MSLKILARTFLGVAMLTAAPVLAADPEPEVSLRFELSLGAGVAGLDSFRSTETAFLVNPKINLGPRPEPWRFRLGIRLVRLPPRKDPWGSFQLTSLPPGLDGQPDPPPRPNTIRGDQLRIGPTTIVAPELEVQFRGVGRFRPSISIGAGFSAEEGASKEIAGFGRFRTSRSNSPLISYGGRRLV